MGFRPMFTITGTGGGGGNGVAGVSLADDTLPHVILIGPPVSFDNTPLLGPPQYTINVGGQVLVTDYDDESNPIQTKVDLPPTIRSISSGDGEFVTWKIDPNDHTLGAYQSFVLGSSFDRRTNILIFFVEHTGGTINGLFLNGVTHINNQLWALDDVFEFVSMMKSGLSGRGRPDLGINIDGGTTFRKNSNAGRDKNDRNIIEHGPNVQPTIFKLQRSGGTIQAKTSLFLDLTSFDDGTGTLGTVSTNDYVNHYIFMSPSKPTAIFQQYGQNKHGSLETAKDNRGREKFIFNPILVENDVALFIVSAQGNLTQTDGLGGGTVDIKDFGPLGLDGGIDAGVELESKFFIPSNISNLVSWHDASDTSKIETLNDDGLNVTKLNDISGNEFHLFPTDEHPLTNQVTVNGLNVILFLDENESFDDSLVVASPGYAGQITDSVTIFIVGSYNVEANQGFLEIGKGQIFSGVRLFRGFADQEAQVLDEFANQIFIPAPFFTGPRLETVVLTSTNNFIYRINGFIEGNITYNGLTLGLDQLNIGGLGGDLSSEFFNLNGTIGEVIVYNKALLSSEVEQVESYLAEKWGIPVFSPIDPFNLVSWHDAADTSTITEVAGRVSKWADKSGNGYDVSQSTPSQQPLTGSTPVNTLNVISFAKANLEFLSNSSYALIQDSFNLSRSITISIVASMDNTATDQGLFDINDGAATNTGVSVIKDGTEEKLIVLGVAGTSPGGNNIDIPVNVGLRLRTITVSEVGNAILYRIDGFVIAFSGLVNDTFPTNELDRLDIGQLFGAFSGFSLDGFVAEMIVYNRLLDSNEIHSMETYLAGKWGIDFFSPKSISNLVAWYDAADVHTITDDLGNVSKWADKSGERNDAIQTNPAKRPRTRVNTMNTLNVINFSTLTTGEDFLVAPLNRNIITEELTYYVVTKRRFVPEAEPSTSTLTGLGELRSDDDNNPESFVGFRETAPSGAELQGKRNNFILSSGTHPGTFVDYFAGGIFDGTSHTMYINGANQGSVSNSGTTNNFVIERLFIGSRVAQGSEFANYHGDIAEVIVYDKALDDIERRKLETYLSDKWDIFIL